MKWRYRPISRPVYLLLTIGLVAFVGVVSVLLSHAATPYINLEPETGTLKSPAVSLTDSIASGGKAVKFGVGTATDGPLPFVLPSQAVLKAAPHKVYAHYFTPYPISFYNDIASNDTYVKSLLSPDGENGIHTAYGGLLRDRPIPRAINTSATWQLDDMKTEVKRATNAGLDGFTVDVLALSGSNWDRLNLLLQAAPQVDPSFKIMLMPDGNAIQAHSYAYTDYAAAMAGLSRKYGNTLAHTNDGRLIISPFHAELNGLTYWTDFNNLIKTSSGINVALVPCFLDYTSTLGNQWAAISYGFSSWGSRSPSANSTTTAISNANDSHALGKIWMQPVSVQDERPNQHIYNESNNTENLRLTWNNAVQGADWVQVPTWNDFSEGAQLTPSWRHGWAPLDISSYYLTQYKIGKAPLLTRDVLYVSHRIQTANATVTSETLPMTLRTGTTPARDTIEVLSFLPTSAAVTVKIGSTTQTYIADAGIFVKTFPLIAVSAGGISASVSRGGTVTATVISPYAVIMGNVAVQDEQYYFASSVDGMQR